MDFLVKIVVVTMAFVGIKGQNFYPGDISNDLQLLPQSLQQRYVEILQQITQNQMKEQELINSQVSHANSGTYPQGYHEIPAHQQNGFSHPHQNDHLRLQLAYTLANGTFQDKQTNSLPSISPAPSYRQLEAAAFTTKRFLKPIPFFPDTDKQTVNESKAVSETIAQESVQEVNYAVQIQLLQLKEKWLNILKQLVAHFKALEVPSEIPKESLENEANFQYLSQNARQNEQNYGKDAQAVYDLIRSNNQDKLEKQRAQLKAETIANAPRIPPTQSHQEINVQYSPARYIAHSSVPGQDLATDWVPVSGSYQIKDPHYENPKNIIIGRPLPTTNIDTNDANHVAPTKFEQHIPFPTTNLVYGDRPYQSNQYNNVDNQMHSQGNWQINYPEWRQ